MKQISYSMQIHYDAKNVRDAVIEMGGPDITKYWNVEDGDTVYLEFPNWEYMNEFLSREESLWWDYFNTITGIRPGEGFYLDF